MYFNSVFLWTVYAGSSLQDEKLISPLRHPLANLSLGRKFCNRVRQRHFSRSSIFHSYTGTFMRSSPMPIFFGPIGAVRNCNFYFLSWIDKVLICPKFIVLSCGIWFFVSFLSYITILTFASICLTVFRYNLAVHYISRSKDPISTPLTKTLVKE